MKNKALFSLLFLSLFCYAQETEPIQTDRPDQTETPAIVPKGMFQVETGFSFQKNKQNNNTNTLPSTLWKYGVNENFELRLITEFVSERIEDRTFSGLNPISLSRKKRYSCSVLLMKKLTTLDLACVINEEFVRVNSP